MLEMKRLQGCWGWSPNDGGGGGEILFLHVLVRSVIKFVLILSEAQFNDIYISNVNQITSYTLSQRYIKEHITNKFDSTVYVSCSLLFKIKSFKQTQKTG